MNSAAAGDRILLKSGLYDVEKLVVRAPSVSIENLPGHAPEIRFNAPSEYSLLVSESAQNIILQGLILSRTADGPGNIIGLGGHHACLRRCRIAFDASQAPKKYDCVKILANHILIEDCEIYGAPNQGIDAVGQAHLVFRRNLVHGCANAIVVKGGSRHVLIEENYCRDLRHGAIGVGGTTDPRWHNRSNTPAEAEDVLVARNVIEYERALGIGGGIFLMGARSTRVYHNTIIGAGIHVRSGGDPARLEKKSANNRIDNNIVFSTGNDGILVIDEDNDAELRVRNNLYWRTATATGEFKLHGSWMGYSRFRTSAPFNQDSIFADPLFKDMRTRDYRLRPGSPAAAAGRAENGLRNGTNIGALPIAREDNA
ncbi:right-handed parallel beta-helix repeat-containing protein [Sulfurifustis variabilis]|uniref:right-handed parallel beta-helix repeat-containing protein n=1 Tax=Sulfurifustis variabilis TaxID=1675686 RepID=UPI0014760C80|nr:right-handed parallel beta-helix repeat-containing protein [Sulfurifustis variabilis]